MANYNLVIFGNAICEQRLPGEQGAHHRRFVAYARFPSVFLARAPAK